MTTNIHTAAEVTRECLTACEEIYEGFFDHGDPIDWFAFYDRLEAWGWCIADVSSPAALKIQRHIRKFKKEAGS